MSPIDDAVEAILSQAASGLRQTEKIVIQADIYCAVCKTYHKPPHCPAR